LNGKYTAFPKSTKNRLMPNAAMTSKGQGNSSFHGSSSSLHQTSSNIKIGLQNQKTESIQS
jgi:hypothetical protein